MRVIIVLTYEVVGRIKWVTSVRFGTVPGTSMCSCVSYSYAGCLLRNSIKNFPQQATWNGNIFEWGTRGATGIYWGRNERKWVLQTVWKTGMRTRTLWDFWERRICPNTRAEWNVLGQSQLRKNKTNTISFQGKWWTWWTFKDTGAVAIIERCWKLAGLTGLILLVVAAELVSAEDPCSLHLELPETSPSVPINIALPWVLKYVPVSPILSYSHWNYVVFQ